MEVRRLTLEKQDEIPFDVRPEHVKPDEDDFEEDDFDV